MPNNKPTIGVARASRKETLEDLFEAKFSEALKTVGKKFGSSIHALYEARREFRDEIVDIIGTDLNGYTLDRVPLIILEQTAVSHLY